MEESLGELEALKGDASAYIERLGRELAQIEGELESLEGQVEQKEQEIRAAARSWRSGARQAEARQYESMKLRIRYMYERGETSFLDMLFQSDSVSQLPQPGGVQFLRSPITTGRSWRSTARSGRRWPAGSGSWRRSGRRFWNSRRPRRPGGSRCAR